MSVSVANVFADDGMHFHDCQQCRTDFFERTGRLEKLDVERLSFAAEGAHHTVNPKVSCQTVSSACPEAVVRELC